METEICQTAEIVRFGLEENVVEDKGAIDNINLVSDHLDQREIESE
jgi:hypothetical protein